ncbi:MAG: hypothetical protein LBL99_02320 [Holosporaceae bacterium]|jgi:hypothetical protein|nr:hypothetical protein [Holosporaceae bacterium]
MERPLDASMERPAMSPGMFSGIDAISGVTENGVALVNNQLSQLLYNITPDQHRKLVHRIMNGELRQSKLSYKWWRFVEAFGDPLSQLGMLACVVIPMIPASLIGNEKVASFMTSISGMASLILSKVHGYAKNKTEEWEKMDIILQAIRDGDIEITEQSETTEEEA